MATVTIEAGGDARSTSGAIQTNSSGTVGNAAQGTALATGYAVGQAGVPPVAPTLTAPATNAAADLTTQAFQWTYVQPQGLAQGAYALRFMLQGTTAWLWYDAAAGALVSAEIYNPSSAQTATPGVPPLGNGQTYAWQGSVQSSAGISSAYSTTSFVTGSPQPVVTPTGPSGTQTVGSVLLTWINSQVAQIASWQVILYTLTQTQATGFAAGSSPWVWNSGLILGSASSDQLPSVQPGSYVAYIQSTSSLGESSAWTSWSLAYSYTQPTQPTLTATWDASNITTTLAVSGVTVGDLVSVYRSLDNGATWTVVSSFDQVAASATTVNGTDYTPLGSQTEGSFPNVDYYAVQSLDGLLSPRSTTEVVTPTFAQPTGQTPSPGWNFLDTTTYEVSYQPMITKYSQSQAIRGGLHQVLGYPYQIQTYDVVEARTIKLEAVTLAVKDWISLRAMLESAHQFYVTNVYGLVGFFAVDPKGYDETQEIGTVAATIRHAPFAMTEYARLPQEGAGT